MHKPQTHPSFFAAFRSGSGAVVPSSTGSLAQRKVKRRAVLLSLGIAACSLVVAFAPLPGVQQTVVVVGGTELQEILPVLETKFEQQYPSIDLELKFQGSQDMVNNYVDDKNDFTPTVLIPANGEFLTELRDRWQAQNGDDPFYDPPQPIAKTILVAIAWSERGNTLFPSGQFEWPPVEQALQAGSWASLGGKSEWGSVDLVITDPTRSNSGQLALGLWAQAKLGTPPTAASLNTPAMTNLFALVKRSVYQPPRSTDVLLQEFIARGPNDADVAIVYESIALHRWQQSATTQGKPYQIYYMDPTVETVSTAAIVQREVSSGTAEAARTFLTFLTQPEQQAVFVQYGFRPVNPAVDPASVPNSPWSQRIPGATVNPPNITPPPDRDTLTEIIKLWDRSS